MSIPISKADPKINASTINNVAPGKTAPKFSAPREAKWADWGFGRASCDPCPTPKPCKCRTMLLPTWLTTLVTKLQNGNVATRKDAAYQLGEKSDLLAVPYLIKALKDKDEGVRASAALALGKIRGRGYLDVAKLLKDGNAKVRAAAAHALKDFKNRKAFLYLAARLRLEKTADVRDAIIQALASLAESDGKIKFDISETKLIRGVLPILIRSLKSKNEFARLAAVRLLVATKDRRVVPAMIRSLGDTSQDVRSKAKHHLAKVGKSTIPSLIKALGSKKKHVPEGAWKALAIIGKPAVPALVVELKNTNANVRLMAVKALGYIEQEDVVPHLIARLKEDGDARVRIAAAVALGKRDNPKIAAALFVAFKDSNSEVRKAAVKGSAVSEIKDRAAVLAYVALLKDGDADVRSAAERALGEVLDKHLAPIFVGLLRNPAPQARRASVNALNNMKAWKAAPQIANLLKDADVGVRRAAASALYKIGTWSMTSPLAQALKDNDKIVRMKALAALSRLNAWKHWPQIAPLLKDREKDVRRMAVAVLSRLKVWHAWPQLAKALKDSDAVVRRSAARTLGELKAWQAWPQLAAALNDPNPTVRGAAARALGEVNAWKSWPDLVRRLRDVNADVRGSVAEALGKVNAWIAGEELTITLWNDKNESARKKAAWALGQLKYEKAIPRLVDQLEEPGVAKEAVEALVKIGKPAVKPLIDFLTAATEYREVIFAIDALGKLGDVRAIDILFNHAIGKHNYSYRNYEHAYEVDNEDKWNEDRICKMQKAAKHALLGMGRRAVPHIIKHLSDYNDFIKANGAILLGQIGDRRAVPHLIKLVAYKHDRGVRRQAARALGMLKDKRAIPALTKALKDKYAGARRAAFEALQAIKNSQKN